MQASQVEIVERPSFHAVGLRWEGTFQEAAAGDIRQIHRELQQRTGEITEIVDRDYFYGLSFHATPDSQTFIHYAAYEVASVNTVPAGMEAIEIPSMTYVRYQHHAGDSIEQSYNYVYSWIESQGLKPASSEGLTHVEIYTSSSNPFASDPEFTILIPIGKSE